MQFKTRSHLTGYELLSQFRQTIQETWYKAEAPIENLNEFTMAERRIRRKRKLDNWRASLNVNFAAYYA